MPGQPSEKPIILVRCMYVETTLYCDGTADVTKNKSWEIKGPKKKKVAAPKKDVNKEDKALFDSLKSADAEEVGWD